MAASGAPERQPRRGPAPIASFDHDGSDEVRPPSSPETKQAIRLPEIREDSSCSAPAAADALAPPEQRARSHSTPAAGGLATPAAPRIDISRASSSSHQDSRDSSPELALFAGGSGDGRGQLELGFREDGALELRSSTEELAFLEPAPGEPRAPPPAERRHSRKDSQGSEAALLAVSGRTSRLSSVGSQCSAHSALSGFSHASRVSRLSVVSGVSRSPSPHKMLLETSFCGPKPIETDPEICAAAVEERLLEMAKLTSAPAPIPTPVDARDRREVRTEATVERASSRPSSANRAVLSGAARPAAPVAVPAQPVPAKPADTQPPTPDGDKKQKETKNRARAEERRARPRDRRENRELEIRQPANRSKDIIRIKLKPDSEYEDDDEDESERTLIGSDAARKPASLALGGAARPTELAAGAAAGAASPTPQRQRLARDSRTPSPAGPVVSRKSSFCSLFKSRETIASPDSPSDALRRKKSLTEGRSRSRSRDRSATPTSTAKIRGSVLSLFRTPRKSATSPSPSSRDSSPVVQPQRQIVPSSADKTRRNDRLKYYEESKDGIIHIPLRTPPDELKPDGGPSGSNMATAVSTTNQIENENEIRVAEVMTHVEPRPASAPQPRAAPAVRSNTKPVQRIVLPDGSIIIPLHSPTEKIVDDFPVPSAIETTLDKKNEKKVDAVVQSPAQSITSPTSDSTTKGPEPPPEVLQERSTPAARTEPAAANEIDERPRRKERIMFSTHVGSRDQVFSTQFSITKTPSVTSEMSESFPSFPDEELRPLALRDTHIATASSAATPAGGSAGSPATSPHAASPHAASPHAASPAAASPFAPSPLAASPAAASPFAPSPLAASPAAASPPGALRDSSESEPSSEAAPARCGSDVEQRGLVVQESFEEELPYVPTTLPLERSLALPMVPVRERGGVRVAALQRPRAAATPPAPPRSVPPAAVPPPATAPTPAAADKLRIRLPRRPRTTSASGPSRSERTRTRSGSEGYETRPKTEWIDFEEVPERRKQPKRIQTLPAAGAARDVVFNYVEPEHCRCECHAHAEPAAPSAPADDLPPLAGPGRNPRPSAAAAGAALARPFTGDLGLRDQEPRPH